MKKLILLAIVMLLVGCYTPMNNSGVSTNKPWIDVSGTRLDFNGDQYDSCVKFNLRFWPQEAAERINLYQSCITACCWRSEKNEVTLDFNKDFEKELVQKGRARKYTPGQVTLKVTHSNFVNLTKVTVSPHGAINNKGLLKLKYEEIDDPERLAQLQAARNAVRSPSPETTREFTITPTKSKKTNVSTQTAPSVRAVTDPSSERAKQLLQLNRGTQIDTYFYGMNKTYRKQGSLFLLSSRFFQATPYGQDTFLVSCHAKARTGIEETQLKASDFSCGKWIVNVQNETVEPYDTKAKTIASL